jgi:response regulator RpfG family c-di-GMP phosphodiesterase
MSIILLSRGLKTSYEETKGIHLERIREYAEIIAEEMAKNPKYASHITPAYIDDIYQSSILHDIGKVGVPDAVLIKAG